MEDPNLIACLFPAESEEETKSTWDTIRMNKNNQRCRYIPQIEQDRGSRESTASTVEHYDPRSGPGLQLTFNPGPKAGQGLVFGTDRNSCDIVLPNLKTNTISRRHCYLTFDAKRRLVLRDCSRHGTIVEYDHQGGETRRTIVTRDKNGQEKHHYFTWILSGAEGPNEAEKIVIEIQNIKFQIIVSKDEIHSPRYIEDVDRFILQAVANEELPLGVLGIQSTSTTAAQSSAQTPDLQSHPPIYIKQKRIGKGKFSIVRHVWDVSTGFQYAAKYFINMTKFKWKREASIMRQVSQLSNEHIVQFVDLIESPSPHMILEYLPLGNLQDQDAKLRITYQESFTILYQSLDALTSVHEEGIGHRDIKPENILVLSRDPLHIKLSDFGLSKDTDDLKTFCGTPLYKAPEIDETRGSMYYTKACDIWSLGVVVFQYAYGSLPHFEKGDNGLRWCNKIIESLNNWDSDTLGDFLSSAMVVREPKRRRSARYCWEQASKLDALSPNRCPTPTQASYSASDFLKRTSDLYASAASGTPTEATTYIRTSQATVDHDLIGYDSEEQEAEDQQSLADSSNEGRTPKLKRKEGSKMASPLPLSEISSHIPRHSTSHSSSVVRRSKRVRQTQRNLDPQYPRSVDPTDLFGVRKRLRSSKSNIPEKQPSKPDMKKLQADESLERNVRGLLAERIDEHDREGTVAISPARVRMPHIAHEENTTLESPRNDLPGVQITVGKITQTFVGKQAGSHFVRSLSANEDTAEVTGFHDRYFRVEIDDQAVLMRKEDGFLNATQIISLANKNDSERRNIMTLLKEKTTVEVLPPTAGIPYSHSWINFQHGQILLKHLGLEQKLQPLIDHGRKFQCDSETVKPIDDYLTEKPSQFITLPVLPRPVSIRRSDLRVNATHVIQASGRNKLEINQIKKEHELCQRYNLAELEEGLRQAWQEVIGEPVVQPVAEQRPSEFIEITDFQSPVIVLRTDCRINASNILKLAGHSRMTMQNLKKSLPANSYQILKGGVSRYQGTYVDFDIGIQLCQDCGLIDLEERLMSSKSVPERSTLEARPSPARCPSQALEIFPRLPSFTELAQTQISDRGPSENHLPAHPSFQSDLSPNTHFVSEHFHSISDAAISESGDIPSIRMENKDSQPTISYYKSMDYQPQSSRLGEFKPDLKTQSLETTSPYESFSNPY